MKLAIDLGGTNIRIAQVANGQCIKKCSVVCPALEDSATILNQLFALIQSMMNGQVSGIGIGVPSIVDPENGIVYNVANIPSWKEIHLKSILEHGFGVPVAISNDSNCFALGESLYGAGRHYANMVGVTLGTGVGAGVIINHRLYGGLYLGAGEIGSLPYKDSDFEHYCSSFFFKQYGTSGEELAEKAKQYDETALEIWKEFGVNMGNLMKAIIYTYAPQVIVLGGGIVSAYPYFKQSMATTMKDFPYDMILTGVRIALSECPDAALVGASELV